MSNKTEFNQHPQAVLLSDEGEEEPARNEDFLEPLKPFLSLSLEVSVELGRGQIALRDLMDLRYHSIFRLDKMAGDNLDILANGILLGRGEVMITDERASIKINEIVESSE